jgi:hypothetical protein
MQSSENYKLKKQLVQYIIFSFRSIILVLCKSVLSLSLISFSFTHDIGRIVCVQLEIVTAIQSAMDRHIMIRRSIF